jgi:hypothetical protein
MYDTPHRKNTMNTTDKTDDVEVLIRLERLIARGVQAYDRRNAVIVALVERGHKQADIARIINRVREKIGVPVITSDAIAAVVKRYKQGNP